MFVETKREGESVVREPSVAGFKAWLEMQPRCQRFNFGSLKHCALGEYLTSLSSDCFTLSTNNWSLYKQLERFPESACQRLSGRQTFGDVLAEIERTTTFKTA